MKSRNLFRNDLILVGIILAFAAIAFAAIYFTGENGKTVCVSIDGKNYSEYSLEKNLEKEIVSEYGKNILIISEGKAFVSEADCRDKICVKHNPISKKGETVICLPHRLVVEIK